MSLPTFTAYNYCTYYCLCLYLMHFVSKLCNIMGIGLRAYLFPGFLLSMGKTPGCPFEYIIWLKYYLLILWKKKKKKNSLFTGNDIAFPINPFLPSKHVLTVIWEGTGNKIDTWLPNDTTLANQCFLNLKIKLREQFLFTLSQKGSKTSKN